MYSYKVIILAKWKPVYFINLSAYQLMKTVRVNNYTDINQINTYLKSLNTKTTTAYGVGISGIGIWHTWGDPNHTFSDNWIWNDDTEINEQ